ncbi:MAG: DUF1902 domain-containing protein [Oxalobacteraceae bacterium]|nr:MAG: DUF1902 domain-containing protein [Oxalobacteraceae bacterium]
MRVGRARWSEVRDMFFDRHLVRNWLRQLRGEAQPVELKVHLAFDEEASVWYVAHSDIPGLHLEAETPDELVRRIAECAPEMIELNQDELIRKHYPSRDALRVRPVFDSAFSLGSLAHAC